MILAEFEGDLKGKGLGVFGKKTNIFVFESISFNVFRGINALEPGKNIDRLAAGGVQVGEISLSRTSDACDALILQAMCTATKPIAKVTLTINNGNATSPADYMVLELSEVYISSYSVSSGGQEPQASLSLNFTKFSITTSSTKSDNSAAGKNTFVWNIATGAKP
jgi:type VI secretion system secreted protein Hcp